ncbi:hypothetical protein BGZ49_009005 [Haplosporangium sp. Z 27]|nr:hypothetical protein BGZ49_009005 [Haplosporangium sp. Z 27]
METKKRPNEESLQSEITPSTNATSTDLNPNNGSVDNNGSIPIETDNPKSDSAVGAPSKTTSSYDNSVPLSGEANKRLRLTMETERIGTVYSPSMDLEDPSKEATGLANWTEDLEKDIKDKGSTDLGPIGSSLSGSNSATDVNHAQEHLDTSAGKQPIISENSNASLNSGNITDKDPTSSHESSETKAPASDMNDSIMAVPTLSEPLMTTLEMIKDNPEPEGGEPVTQTPNRAEPSTSTSQTTVVKDTPPNLSSTSQVDALPQNPAFPSVTDNASVASVSHQSDQTAHPVSNATPSPDNEVQSFEKQTNDDKPVPAQTTDIEMEAAENTNGEDTVMTSPTLISSSISAGSTTEPSETDSKDNQKDSDQIAVQDAPQNVAKETIVEEVQSLPPIQQTQFARVTSPSPPSSLNSESRKPLNTEQLPPPTSPISQQSARPRSTMSVSALLVNNDDDDGAQESHSGRNISSNIFEQFESPRLNQSHSSPRLAQQETSHTQLNPPLQQHSQAPRSASVAAQSQNVASSPRTSGATITHNISDQPDISPTSHSSHSGFNRTVTESGQNSRRTSDATTVPLTRGAGHKEYPADEVMESGGVSGYANQRHRLASPVGIRPPTVTTNGASGGAAHHSGKLPGVGSVTGLPSTHLQDSRPHPSSSFRGENTHQSINERSSSYSPNQHTPMSHSTNINGQQYTSHSGVTSATTLPSLSSTSPTTSSHYPCLIIKNDPSLKLDSHTESFLGYYRYDTTLLLPSMQGKENSLLEVRVASSYLTYDNIKVKRREIWGTEIYTDDSDIVAMLIHSGFFIPPISINSTEQDSIQPKGQQHNFASEPIKHICPGYDLAVTLRVVPKLIKYQGSIRHRINSRTWKTGHDGVSLKIEAIRKMFPGEALNRGRSQSKRRMKEYNQERLRVLSNIHDETTESLQNERAMRTATFEFTHQGDPCFKYSPELVMDRHDGLSRKWTSWRLKKEVMILENDEERYEISLQHHAGTDARRFDQYRFAVISPRTSLSGWSKTNYPLDTSSLSEVLYEDLDWQDFEWVERGVVVQPSQRSKQALARDDSINLMEGVEPTSETLPNKSQIDPQHDTVGTQDNEIKDKEREANQKTRMGAPIGGTQTETIMSESLEPKTQDVQQDGVFCVVSRLFWRPITEHRLTAPTSSSHATENKTTKKSEESLDSISPENPTTIPPVSEVLRNQNEPNADPAINLNALKSGSNSNISSESGLATHAAFSEQPPSTLPAITNSPVPSRTLPEPSMNVANQDTIVSRREPSEAPRPDVARPAILNEHEEGELEEGEIASE